MSNSINQQMTALANAVRNKANIQSKLTIANMITILSGLNLTGSDITLGEIDQNGNFQPLTFSGSEASISGSPISISSYYTWNNISSTSTPTIEEETNADITALYQISPYGNTLIFTPKSSDEEDNYHGYIWEAEDDDCWYGINYSETEGFYLWASDGTDTDYKYKSDENIHNIIGTYDWDYQNRNLPLTKVTE